MTNGKVQRVLFVTGAGLSADSGLPTYRGLTGLYNQGETEDGCTIEDAISGEMMESRPEVAWKYVAQIEESCRGAAPNDGHLAITRLQEKYEVWVLTQNVDAFHQRAGTKNVIAIHGEIHKLKCTACSYKVKVDDFTGLTYNKAGETARVWPQCPKCSGLVRPHIVLFGEELPDAALSTYQTQLRKGFDAVFSVGTTSVFAYIAAPIHLAKKLGGLTVEVNPGETEVTSMVQYKAANAASFLKKLADRIL